MGRLEWLALAAAGGSAGPLDRAQPAVAMAGMVAMAIPPCWLERPVAMVEPAVMAARMAMAGMEELVGLAPMP